MRALALFHAAWLVLLTGCCCCSGLSAPSTPATPEEKAFGAANRMISVYKADDGGAYGNTPEAKELATAFAALAESSEKELFSGGKEGGLSLSDGHFVTYCRQNNDSVCFLVHVPQLKNYKDDVRDALVEMCWSCAEEVLEGKVAPGTEVAVALRGSLLYGGLATGKLGETPTTEQTSVIDQDQLHKFFKEAGTPDPVPATTPAEGDENE